MPKRPSTESHVRPMSGVPPRPVEWLWPGWIPLGKLTVLDGDPGVGKSTLLLDLAARLSRDGVMPDGAVGPVGASLILSAEDGEEDTIKPRLAAAGGVAERIFTLPAVRGDDGEMRPPEVPLDLPAIEAAVRQYGARLLVIDPLMAYLTGADAGSDQDVRRALFKLARLAERRSFAVVCLRHLSKVGGDKAIYRGGGSIGIVAAARSGLVVAADPDDPDRRIWRRRSATWRRRRGRCGSPWRRATASAGCAGWARRTSRPTSWCGGCRGPSWSKREEERTRLQRRWSSCATCWPTARSRRAIATCSPTSRASPGGRCNGRSSRPASGNGRRRAALSRCGSWIPARGTSHEQKIRGPGPLGAWRKARKSEFRQQLKCAAKGCAVWRTVWRGPADGAS